MSALPPKADITLYVHYVPWRCQTIQIKGQRYRVVVGENQIRELDEQL